MGCQANNQIRNEDNVFYCSRGTKIEFGSELEIRQRHRPGYGCFAGDQEIYDESGEERDFARHDS